MPRPQPYAERSEIQPGWICRQQCPANPYDNKMHVQKCRRNIGEGNEKSAKAGNIRFNTKSASGS